jgi:pilus assembly protein CpaF
MRPDRLVVGEVRGAEAIDMVLAMTSGHTGCWSSVHATDAFATLPRIAHIIVRDAPQWSRDLALEMAMSAIDAVIHMSRRPGGRRRIEAIVAFADGASETLWCADQSQESPSWS